MSDITIIVPTSPIPSNPSTAIIDRTLSSIHQFLPDAPTIVMCDGLRGERYMEFKEALRGNTTAQFEFDTHLHQSAMLTQVLPSVQTPLIYFLEHDWETLPGVPWKELSQLILGGQYKYIKLHAAPRIHPAHEHLMGDRVIWYGDKQYPMLQDGNPQTPVPVIETVQYSANPHLALTEWYRELARKYLEGKTDFIENILHGPLSKYGPRADMAIYNPPDGDMFRVRHLDGKGTL